MPLNLEIEFVDADTKLEPNAATIVDASCDLGPVAKKLDKDSDGHLKRAMSAADFSGKSKTSVPLLAPQGSDLKRLTIVGAGDLGELNDTDWAMLGGYTLGQLTTTKDRSASILFECESLPASKRAAATAAFAQGALLRSYKFDKYKTKKNSGDDAESTKAELTRLVVHTKDPAAAKKSFTREMAVATGVALTRDLVNEPANTLGPVEFAAACSALDQVGVEVEIFDTEQLADIGMHALLAVAQGSERPARVAVMQWHGAKTKRAKALCFIGKGVCFDTGGISMKPAGGMEDMKGDMGGAACVTGLMHALAARRAGVNAVGIVGLVENMPSGTAQRPGDIISSLSGQTIEVLNTDAEGRLVLADLLTYAQERFSPRFMINLATLTGAIIVALGKDHAGMFSNDDRLAADLSECGLATGEKVWRMPLSKAYDKLINTPNADMKNIGGRWGGAITAAQFLQRFVDKAIPWAHLDVAGTAMASEKTEISKSWASGWGVRLLDRLVSEKYER
ncbi:MAG: leucyl aminopeptidase [Hyphomicrobiaceae bacterium]